MALSAEDYSHLSDEELEKIANQGKEESLEDKYSHLSDADLMRISREQKVSRVLENKPERIEETNQYGEYGNVKYPADEIIPPEEKPPIAGSLRSFSTAVIPDLPEKTEARIRSVAGEPYEQSLKNIKSEKEKYSHDFPIEDLAAKGAGTIVGGGLLNKAFPVAKATTTMGISGGQGFLESRQRGEPLKENVKSGLLSAGLGGLVHGGVNLAQGAENAAREWAGKKAPELMNTAKEYAYRALGPLAKNFKKMTDRFEIGGELLKEGIVKRGATHEEMLGELIGHDKIEAVSKIDPAVLEDINLMDVASGGAIGKKAREVDSLVKEADKILESAKVPPINGEQAINELTSKTNELEKGGQHLITQEGLAEKEKIYNSIFKHANGEPKQLTIEGAIELRRNLNPYMNQAYAETKNKMSPKYTAYREARDMLNDYIRSAADEASKIAGTKPLGQMMKQIDESASKLIKASQILQPTVQKQMARESHGLISIDPSLRGVNNYLGQNKNQNMTSIFKNASERLEAFSIPRSTEEILANKQLVLAKFIHAGMPDVAHMLSGIMDKDPRKLPAAMSMTVESASNLYAKPSSGYNSEINGKIYDDRDKKNYEQQIGDNRKLTNTEKAKMVNKMRKTGDISIPKTGG